MRRVVATAARRAGSDRIFPATGRRGRLRACALLVATAVLHLSVTAADASPGASSRAGESSLRAGELTVVGSATIDGTPAVNGQTVFSGSAYTTDANSRSTVSLGNLGRVALAPDTSLRLDFSGAGIAGSLDAGSVRVVVPAGLSAAVKTRDAEVASDAGQPAVFSVGVVEGETTVFVQAGRVEVRGGEALQRLTAGQSFSSAPTPQTQQGSGQSLSGGKRKGLFVAIAAAVAVVVVVLAGRDKMSPVDSACDACFGGPIVPSGHTDNSHSPLLKLPRRRRALTWATT
ncbi:MAG: FecR protein [Acidobacteriota bacterium]|jgi:ferric-dicitrate binding protein FerR (iron transport regulator)|nr:FecR protein [Acidobacteriota bacterium]